ncbi:hypothetical protein [Desulfobaculum bizertense]|nr:hypothetical protein [Desulfobaculum bizertense]UIJ36699.1 hypothetical protein LWC08_08070 [Desulfobaculum bizertense]
MSDSCMCAACARRGQCCCEVLPEDIPHCFPLSQADVERIEAATGIPGKGIARQETVPALVQSLERLFPECKDLLQEKVQIGGQHLRLALEDGACVFLGSEGCTLPRDARPVYCRIYPFWVQKGSIMVFDTAPCVQRAGAAGLDKLLSALDMDRKTVRRLFATLLQEWFPER